MANKFDTYYQITENGFTAVFAGSEVLDQIDELSFSSKEGIKSEAVGSRWGHYPTENTHKELPYPYSS